MRPAFLAAVTAASILTVAAGAAAVTAWSDPASPFCRDGYSAAAARHLPPRGGSPACSGAACGDDELQSTTEWTDRIMALAAQQKDYCVRMAYESLAHRYEAEALHHVMHRIRESRVHDVDAKSPVVR